MINNKYIKNNRFWENDTMWPWISLNLKVEKVLFQKKSKYQDILVFDSFSFGRVLILDWIIQLTQADESAYQEMLSHVPLFVHKNPKKILIIWWWDGWVLREVLKHKDIEKVVLCEIDSEVINASMKYFPEISFWLKNKKTEIFIWDWAEYIQNTKEKFDVIIVDSSDPIWPANSLFNEKFYTKLSWILNKYWVLAIQWESLFLHHDISVSLHKIMKKIFKNSKYCQVHVPTYPWWNIGLLISSNIYDVSKITRNIDFELKKSLKYYSKEVHEASFVLPKAYKI